MPAQPPSRQRPSRKAIVRAVASSTAIETGERIASIEARLLTLPSKATRPGLALRNPARPARR
jgi:hypothetical protein